MSAHCEAMPPGQTFADAFAGRPNHFDLLRLVLAALVVVHHSPVVLYLDRGREAIRDPLAALTDGRADLGSAAVYGFFALSGFLIAASWQREPRLLPYLSKRAARIYPAFMAMAAVCLLLVGPLGAADDAAYLRGLSVPDIAASVAALRLPEMPGVFAANPTETVNVSVWTIAHEFGCYLLVAALGLLGALRHRVLVAALYAAVTAAFAWTTRAGTPRPHGGSLWLPGGLEFWPPLTAWFVAGAALYLYRDRVPYRPAWVIAAWAGWGVCVAAGLVALAPAFGAYALVGTALWPRGDTRSARRFGDLSYGIYLYGWPVQQLLRQAWPGAWNPASLSLAALGISAALAALSWHAVEKRFLASRRVTPPAAMPLGSGTAGAALTAGR